MSRRLHRAAPATVFAPSIGSIPDVLFKEALSFLALIETIVSSASCRRFLTRARKILAELEEINGNKSWYMLTLADPTKQPRLTMKSSGSAPACHPHFPGENPSDQFKWHAHATDVALAFFGKHARSCRRVDLSYQTEVTGVGLKALLDRAYDVNKLSLHSCPRIDDQAMFHLTTSQFCRSLQWIEMQHVVITDTTLGLFGIHCPFLSLLDISWPKAGSQDSVTDRGLAALAAGCRELRVLNVAGRGTGKLTSDGIEEIVLRTDLVNLSIESAGLPGLTSAVVELLEEHRKDMMVGFSASHLTDADVIKLATSQAGLRHLFYTDLCDISEAALGHLRRATDNCSITNLDQ